MLSGADHQQPADAEQHGEADEDGQRVEGRPGEERVFGELGVGHAHQEDLLAQRVGARFLQRGGGGSKLAVGEELLEFQPFLPGHLLGQRLVAAGDAAAFGRDLLLQRGDPVLQHLDLRVVRAHEAPAFLELGPGLGEQRLQPADRLDGAGGGACRVEGLLALAEGDHRLARGGDAFLRLADILLRDADRVLRRAFGELVHQAFREPEHAFRQVLRVARAEGVDLEGEDVGLRVEGGADHAAEVPGEPFQLRLLPPEAREAVGFRPAPQLDQVRLGARVQYGGVAVEIGDDGAGFLGARPGAGEDAGHRRGAAAAAAGIEPAGPAAAAAAAAHQEAGFRFVDRRGHDIEIGCGDRRRQQDQQHEPVPHPQPAPLAPPVRRVRQPPDGRCQSGAREAFRGPRRWR
jgi:hypothetical protein